MAESPSGSPNRSRSGSASEADDYTGYQKALHFRAEAMNDVPLTPLRMGDAESPQSTDRNGAPYQYETPTHFVQNTSKRSSASYSYSQQSPVTSIYPPIIPSVQSIYPDPDVEREYDYRHQHEQAAYVPGKKYPSKKSIEWWEFGSPKKIIAENWRQPLAELIGTTLLVFLCTASFIALVHLNGLDGGTVIGAALGTGFGTLATSATIRQVSGAHMNPAVTIAVMLVMKMPIFKGIMYIVCQVVGALLGAALVKGAIPDQVFRAINYGVPLLNYNATTLVPPTASTPANTMSLVNLCFLEIMLSIFAVFVYLLTAKLPRDPIHTGHWMPVANGAAVAACAFFTTPLTGIGVNPLRAFGPAVISGSLADHWVFWLGPIVGAVLAAAIYKVLRSGPTVDAPTV